MTLRLLVRAVTWPVRCLGVYLLWCFRVAIHAILLVSGEDLDRSDE